MKKHHILVVLLLTFLLSSRSAYNQTEAPPKTEKSEKEGIIVRTEVNLVNLAVNARLIDGGFAKAIKKEEFHIYEDGVEQVITNFSQEAVPAHVALLIDISGSMRFEWGSIKNAARRFVSELRKEDQFAVIAFNHEARLVQDWTNSVEKVEKALSSIFPKGQTALYDAVYVAFDDLLKNVQGKKAVIILTDGFDNISKVTYTQALDLAVKSGALVYIVSQVESLRTAIEFEERQQGRKSGMRPEDYYGADLSLKKLAFETGGKVLQPNSLGELGDVYSKVAEELKNQYSIGYVPSNNIKDGSYRKIEIKVDRAEVVASTRPGYFAPSK